MGNICIIPARGGSKRIPRKNIRPFFGRPVISYAIETALKSGLFEEVMVSTEDAEISQIAQDAGAQVPFLRSAETANDIAGTVDVILEVIKGYEKLGREFTNGCCLYPVTPLTTTQQLRQGFEKLTNGFHVVFPVIPFSYPIWRAVKQEDETLHWLWPEYAGSRSQDLPKALHDAGQWYWFEVDTMKEQKVLLGERTSFIELSEHEVQDVDNEDDWKMMELKFRLRDDQV